MRFFCSLNVEYSESLLWPSPSSQSPCPSPTSHSFLLVDKVRSSSAFAGLRLRLHVCCPFSDPEPKLSEGREGLALLMNVPAEPGPKPRVFAECLMQRASWEREQGQEKIGQAQQISTQDQVVSASCPRDISKTQVNCPRELSPQSARESSVCLNCFCGGT